MRKHGAPKKASPKCIFWRLVVIIDGTFLQDILGEILAFARSHALRKREFGQGWPYWKLKRLGMYQSTNARQQVAAKDLIRKAT